MDDCIFCRIIKKAVPVSVEYEDDQVLAFHDINPQAPAHLLIIPKKHLAAVQDLREGDEKLIGNLIVSARKIAAKNHWNDYRLIFNNGAEAGQTVFHIHLHLMSGRRFAWPPG